MTAITMKRGLNTPIVSALWLLTLVAIVPFPNVPLMLLGAAANLNHQLGFKLNFGLSGLGKAAEERYCRLKIEVQERTE